MLSESPLIGIEVFGTRFRRYRIVTSRNMYWTGHAWVADPGEARLYADGHLVSGDVHDLLRNPRGNRESRC